MLSLILLVACKREDTFHFGGDTDDTDLAGDTEATDTEPQDTDLPGTDNDGDGWTVEEGDCDDNDIFVNPAWDERPNDNKDNDCDGLVDEAWAGLAVLESDIDFQPVAEVFIDPFGTADPAKMWSQPSYPVAMTRPISSNEGWVVTDVARHGVLQVSDSGTVTDLWIDDTEYDYYTQPPGYFGIVAHPDGYYLVSGGDRLWRIQPDGTMDVAAEWDCFEPPEGATDICPTDLAVDPVTGVVGLFGFYGGFATWTPDDGLNVIIPDPSDTTLATHEFFQSVWRKEGGFFAFGADLVTGDTGIFRWDDALSHFALKGLYPSPWNADFTEIDDLTVESETGDFYMAAHGGQHRIVLRMTADGTYVAMLYPADLEFDPDETLYYTALAPVYTADP